MGTLNNIVLKMMLYVALAACLVTLTVAQPPMATTPSPGGFFHQVGGVIKDTAESLGGAFVDYAKDEGKNILHNVLPGLAGNFIHDGFWSILNSIKDTAGKRDVDLNVGKLHDELVAKFQGQFQGAIDTAVRKGEDLEKAFSGLVTSLKNGRVAKTTYLELLKLLKPRGQQILTEMTSNIRKQMSAVLGDVPLQLASKGREGSRQHGDQIEDHCKQYGWRGCSGSSRLI